MTTWSARIGKIYGDSILLTDIKRCGLYEYENQRIKRGRWSKRLTDDSEGYLIGFNAEISTYRLCDTDGESYKTVSRTRIKPTSIAGVITTL